MPTNKELLESLRDEFEQLEVFDSSGLKGLKHRGEMIIRRVFGKDSQYIERLSDTAFSVAMPIAVSSNPSVQAESEERRRQGQQSIWLTGQREAISLVDTMLEELELEGATPKDSGEKRVTPKSNGVFVVHGHDNEMKQAVARTVERLGLEAVILHEKTNRGQTIIEKIERYSDVGFAVVLLSPDDVGYSNADGSDAAKAPIVSAAIALSTIMIVLGARRLRALRSDR